MSEARPKQTKPIRALAVIAVSLALVPVVRHAPVAPPDGDPVSWVAAIRASAPETTLRTLINQERGAAGLPSLRMRKPLIKISRRHSGRMASAGSIYHNPNLAQDLRRVAWSMAGENVGVGSTIESLHQAFMDSPPHRENVLRSRFRRIGVGVRAVDGRIWVTVVFVG